jgi:hypothetical protein
MTAEQTVRHRFRASVIWTRPSTTVSVRSTSPVLSSLGSHQSFKQASDCIRIVGPMTTYVISRSIVNKPTSIKSNQNMLTRKQRRRWWLQVLGECVEILRSHSGWAFSILAYRNFKKNSRSSVEQGWKLFRLTSDLLEQKLTCWTEMR